MHIEHSVPQPQAPEVRLHWYSTVVQAPGSAARAKGLLSELRHLLENGCELNTALDALDEAEAALHAFFRPSAQPLPSANGAEKLDLAQLLNQALGNSADLIAKSNVVVLNRRFRKRTVLARRHELNALLDEVIQVAVRCCDAVPGARILRVRIHNDHREHPSLIIEHSGNWVTPSEPVLRQAEGVEVSQDHSRCTIALTFINRP